jgi:long-subunit acyl-CoA synthetase (AMP-forming)
MKDMSNIFEDFKAARPTAMASTPRLWNVVYGEYQKVKNRLSENPELVSCTSMMTNFIRNQTRSRSKQLPRYVVTLAIALIV